MRLIDADAFADFIKNAIKVQKYDALKVDDTLTVGEVLESVIAELEGTSIDGFKNNPTIEPEQRWIPCEEERPQFPCIVWLADGHYPRIKMCQYGMFTYKTEEHGEFYVDGEIVSLWETVKRQERKKYSLEALYQNRIVAWLPLPEPYREEAPE